MKSGEVLYLVVQEMLLKLLKIKSLGWSQAMLLYLSQQSVFMLWFSLRQPLLSPTYYLIRLTTKCLTLYYRLEHMPYGTWKLSENGDLSREAYQHTNPFHGELRDETSNEHIPPTVLAYKLAQPSRHIAACIPATSLKS